jgi:hypothetical protein
VKVAAAKRPFDGFDFMRTAGDSDDMLHALEMLDADGNQSVVKIKIQPLAVPIEKLTQNITDTSLLLEKL